MDWELQHIQRPMTSHALGGQPSDAAAYAAASGGYDVMAAILKISNSIRNPTPSVHEHLLDEQSCHLINYGKTNERRPIVSATKM